MEKRLPLGGQTLLKIDQALQMDLRYPILMSLLDQRGQFVQIFAHSSEPERDRRFAGLLSLLQRKKVADVAPDLLKSIYSAYMSIGLARRPIHREAIFVEARVNER